MNVLDKYPFVSAIMPVRNEIRFIERSLQSVLTQDYPPQSLEIIIVDGESTDGTREFLDKTANHNKRIHVLSNVQRTIPFAMNKGIKASKGEIIIRVDAHSEYPQDYIPKCVEYLQKTDAWCVGGLVYATPGSETLIAKSIAVLLSHPFGVGNSLFRIGTRDIKEVDTVPFGCYKREVFERIGLFDERLERSQDIELNKRVKKAGGKILLIPEISCTYFARDSFTLFCKNNFQNGYWVIRAIALTKNFRSHSLRHLVPLGFVLYLLSFFGMFVVFPGRPTFFIIMSIPLIVYVVLNFICSLWLIKKVRDFRLLFPLVFCFFLLHTTYGLGEGWGAFRSFRSK